MTTNDFLPASEARDFTFKPIGGFDIGELDTTPITFIHWLGSKDLGAGDVDSDWAIVELKDPVGKRYGWMKIAEEHAWRDTTVSLDENSRRMEKGIQYQRFENKLLMASFPIDKDDGEILQVQRGCSFYNEPPLTLENMMTRHFIPHDCDSVPGGSGSPIFLIEKDKETGKEVGVIYALNAMYFTPKEKGALAQDSDAKYREAQHLPKFSLEYANGAAGTPMIKRRLDIILKDRDLARRTRTKRDALGGSFDVVDPPKAPKS